MKRKHKYILLVPILVILCYRSCYFERLDTAKQKEKQQAFNHAEYARDLWNNKLAGNLDQAVDARMLLELLNTNMEEAQKKYARTMGIASDYYYLLGGQGKVVSMSEGGVFISIRAPESDPDIIIATSYIYGNAVRDASGFVNVDEFPSSRDFNNISEEINKIVTGRLLPPFLEKVKQGLIVKFVGAAEIRQADPEIHPLRVIPVFLEIQ